MEEEPLILLSAPPSWVLVGAGAGSGSVFSGGRYGFWVWVCVPGENSKAHSSSISSWSPRVLVTVMGGHEKSEGAVSATSLVVVTVAAYELALVVVIVTVRVD